MKKGFKKALLMLLSLVMVFTMMPLATMTAFADEATSAEVTFTLSNQGSFVAGKDGKAVVERPVTVTDLDGDGSLTYDEALVAAHDAYYEGGATAGYDHGTGMVELLWGVSSKNNLFFINEVGLSTGVTADTIKDGDSLYASINADTAYYADWYTRFSETNIEATTADDITVTIKGHLGMAYTDEEKQFDTLGGIQIGTWEDGAFKAIEGAVTGKDGVATFKLDEGEYLLTAKGTVVDEVTAYSLMDLSNNQGYPFGTMSEDMMEWNVAYTDEDYGDGPYPAGEVKYIDFFEEADEDSENDYAWQDLHYLKSNKLLADCPIMAPYANVTVTKPAPAADAEVTFTLSNKGLLASAKDGTAVVEKAVTVKDLDEDGHLTYDEALVAAHDALFEGGAAAGYSTGNPYGYGTMVTKLWGTDSTNNLFMNNDEGIPTGVMMDEVKAGDSLYASVNADAAYYADWFTKFDKKSIEATTEDDITVTLTGRLGMAYMPEDLEFTPLEGIQIGTWKNGAFEAIEGAVTGADGKATFKLPAGEYILTAKGTVEDEVEDWSTGEAQTVTADCPIMAPYANVKVENAEEPEVEKFLYDGDEVNFIKADGSGFGMFTAQEGTTCVLDGDNVVIHYIPKNTTTYEGFNWGSVDKEAYLDESVKPDIEFKANADGSYDITLSKDYCGYAHPVAVVKFTFGGKTAKSWTSADQYYLAIPDLTEDPEKIPYEGEEVNFIKADGTQFGMFTAQEGTTCVLDGDNVVIHYIPKNTTTYEGFNWGSVEKVKYYDEKVQPEIEFKANSDGSYDITLSKDYCGYAHPIAVVKFTYGGKTAKSWTSGDQYYLAIPALEPEVKPGWNKDENGKWYYGKEDGTKATGWTKVSGKWYYMDADGVMQTGWVKISGKWYYFNNSGAMLTGWQKIGGKQYFFKSSGAMASKEWVKGYYWINKDGTWTYKYKASWKKTSSGKWWFGDTSGWYAKNTTIIIDGKSYTFDSKGYLK